MPATIHILMIDDDEEDFIIIRDVIHEIDHNKYTIDWVSTYDEGLNLVKKRKYDFYLVDYRLGPRTGDELIAEAVKNGCDEPMILLTGESNEEADNKALQAGASDYLVKGSFSPRNFETTIRYSIASAKHVKEVKLLNEKLEGKVKERTLVLEKANNELNATREKLEKALEHEKELNELKSRFVSMASHEFRTPLATILSSLSLIARYNEQGELEKQKKHIERIRSSVNNLTDIINDALSLSKLEEGKVMTNAFKCNIEEVTSEIITEMQEITKKNQAIEYTHSGDVEIITDPKVYKHILVNLISNAIKFSPEGSVIQVSTSVKKNKFDFSVKDSGIGIPEEDQKHLFERFFRGRNAVNIQGTGLGLNIVAKYAELLGGKIGCESKLNEGAKFFVSIK